MSLSDILKPMVLCLRTLSNVARWINSRRQRINNWLHSDPRNRIFAVMSMFVVLEFMAIFYVIGYEADPFHPGGIFLISIVGLVSALLIYVLIIHIRSPQRIRSFILANRSDAAVEGVTPEQKMKIKKVMIVQEKEKNSDCCEEMCSICLSEFDLGESIAILPCNHAYHDPCLEEWIGTHHTCPLCNLNLNTYDLDDVEDGSLSDGTAVAPTSIAASS